VQIYVLQNLPIWRSVTLQTIPAGEQVNFTDADDVTTLYIQVQKTPDTPEPATYQLDIKVCFGNKETLTRRLHLYWKYVISP